MCDHNKKVKLFCLTDNCQNNLAYSCSDCLKLHHHKYPELFLNEEDILSLMKKYHVPSTVKNERKQMIYKMYKTLSSLKDEIYNHIDVYFNNTLSKIKYPYLYHENILEIYRLIRDKNYHKIDSQQLRIFYSISRKISNQQFLEMESKIYIENLKQIQLKMQEINSKIEKIENLFDFKISKQVDNMRTSFIQQIRHFNLINKNNGKQIDLDHKNHCFEESSKSILVSSLIFPEKQKGNRYLTPKKDSTTLNISFDQVSSKAASFISNEDILSKSDEVAQEGNQRMLTKSIEMVNVKIKNSQSEKKKVNDRIQQILHLDSIIPSYINELKSSNFLPKNNPKKQEESKQKIVIANIAKIEQHKQFDNISSYNNMLIKVSTAKPNKHTLQNVNKDKESFEISNHLRYRQVLSRNSLRSPNLLYQQPEILTKHPSIVQQIQQKQQKIKKRLDQLIKDREKNESIKSSDKLKNNTVQTIQKIRDKVENVNSILSSKLKSEAKANSYYFSSIKKSNKNDLNESSISKDIFIFQRQQKPKIISRSIKKQIPIIEPVRTLNHSSPIKTDEVASKEEELERAAIFISGINQPSTDAKICFLQKYLEKYENNLTAAQYLSFLYLQKGKLKESLYLSNKYIQKLKLRGCDKKQTTTLIINKTAALNHLGRYSETITILEPLKYSQHNKVHKNLADAYYNIGVHDQAIFHYEKAIKYNIKSDEAFYNLAVLLYLQESYFNAKMNIDKALAINGNNEAYRQLSCHIQQRITLNKGQQQE